MVLSCRYSFRGRSPAGAVESGRSPAFLLSGEEEIDEQPADRHRGALAETAPDVEVLLAEVLGGHTVRLFIDHPEGVTLDLCERVTHLLPEVRERYALEVSSPGGAAPADQARPLPPLPRPPRARAHARRPRRPPSFTGELVGATDAEVTIAADTGVVAIPYADIRKSNLVEE